MESAGAMATLDEFVRCINANDPKNIISLCAADHIFIDTLGSQMSGLEQLEKPGQAIFRCFPITASISTPRLHGTRLYSPVGLHPPLKQHRKSRGAFLPHVALS